MFKYFGPATIIHNGNDKGRTYGGGSIRLLYKFYHEIGDDYDEKAIIYGGEGFFTFYEWETLEISDDPELLAFKEVVITTSTATITLYKCKMMLADESINIGQNSQEGIKVKLIFTEDDSGNLIKIE